MPLLPDDPCEPDEPIPLLPDEPCEPDEPMPPLPDEPDMSFWPWPPLRLLRQLLNSSLNFLYRSCRQFW